MNQYEKDYVVRLTAKSALLMHQDNIEWCDHLKRWREDPKNKSKSVAGDDRSPAFTWLGSLYHDKRFVALPYENVMSCLKEGGAQVPVPGGKHGKTFKTQTQSGLCIIEYRPALLVNGSPIDARQLLALEFEEDFEKHQAAASAAGFSLFVKRARVTSTSKHIRVRPRFDNWSCEFTLRVTDEQITTKALREILRFSGEFKGLGDWRPSSRTPGPFGRFSAEIEELK